MDFYPLEAEINRSGSTDESIIEKIDIGGPTMIRSGSKGGKIVICNTEDRQRVIAWLEGGEHDGIYFRRHLAAKGEMTISQYCKVSGTYLRTGTYAGYHF